MAQIPLDEFLTRYQGSKVVLDLDLDNVGPVNAPYIVLRRGQHVLVLNPFRIGDYVDVDVHGFVDGEPARTGVFGMEAGLETGQLNLADGTRGTSEGRPATAMLALLLGKQQNT